MQRAPCRAAPLRRPGTGAAAAQRAPPGRLGPAFQVRLRPSPPRGGPDQDPLRAVGPALSAQAGRLGLPQQLLAHRCCPAQFCRVGGSLLAASCMVGVRVEAGRRPGIGAVQLDAVWVASASSLCMQARRCPSLLLQPLLSCKHLADHRATKSSAAWYMNTLGPSCL